MTIINNVFLYLKVYIIYTFFHKYIISNLKIHGSYSIGTFNEDKSFYFQLCPRVMIVDYFFCVFEQLYNEFEKFENLEYQHFKNIVSSQY